MAIEVARLVAYVTANVEGLRSNLANADRQLDQTGEKAEDLGKKLDEAGAKGEDAGNKIEDGAKRGKKATSELADSLEKMGARLTALVTVPLVGFGREAANAAVRMDALKRGLQAITGSAGEAERQLERLREIAKTPGVGFEEAAKGSLRLQAAGMSAMQAEKAIRAFGNAIASSGGGKQQLDLVLYDLTELASQSKIGGQEIRRMMMQVPQLREALKSAFGTADSEALRNMGITPQQYIEKAVEALSKLPTLAGSIRNDLDNAADSVNRSMAKIGDSIMRVAARPLQQATDTLATLTEGFQALPRPVQDAITEMLGIAAAVGPIILVTAQILKLRDAIVAARFATAGPVGLIAALAAITINAGLQAWSDDSERIIQNAERPQYADLEDKIREARDKIAALKAAFASPKMADDPQKFMALLQQAGVPLNTDVNTAKDRLKELQKVLSDTEALWASARAAAERGSAATNRAAHPLVPTFDVAQTAELQKRIDELREKVALNGDKTQEAAMKWATLHGEFSKADPKIKAIAIALSAQVDAIKAAEEAHKKAEEAAKRHARALAELSKQRDLALIPSDDPHREERRFRVEQRYAGPEAALPADIADQYAADYRKSDAARVADEAAKKTAEARAQAYHTLENAIQTLQEKQISLAAGESHLTHAEEAALLIAKERLKYGDATTADYARRLMDSARTADALERENAGAQQMVQTLQEFNAQYDRVKDAYDLATGASDKQAVTIDNLTKKYALLLATGNMYLTAVIAQRIVDEARMAQMTEEEKVTKTLADALASANARYLEASGHGDHYADVMARLKLDTKNLTDEQRRLVTQIVGVDEAYEAATKKKHQIDSLAGALSGPFRTLFSDVFEGRGTEAARKFTANFKQMLGGMFGDLLGNQVQNLLKSALSPIYDQMTHALEQGLHGVRLTLGAVHLSVSMIMNSVWGLLAAVGAMGKRQQRGALIGTVLGAVAGSLIPGVGWMLGSSIGGALGASAASGDAGQFAVAAISGAASLSDAGVFGNPGAAAAPANVGGFGSGNVANRVDGMLNAGSRAVHPFVVNVNTGDINNVGGLDVFSQAVTHAVQMGLRVESRSAV